MKQALATAQRPPPSGRIRRASQQARRSTSPASSQSTRHRGHPRGHRGPDRTVLKNIQAILAEQGMTLADVVKTTVFLADMNDFAEMNKVYGEYFAQPFPARSAVQVAKLPKGAPLEIECIAVK